MAHTISVNLWIREEQFFKKNEKVLNSIYYAGVLLPDDDKRHNNPNEEIFLEDILDDQDTPIKFPKIVAKAIIKGMTEDYKIPIDEIGIGSTSVYVYSRLGKNNLREDCLGQVSGEFLIKYRRLNKSEAGKILFELRKQLQVYANK